MEQEAFDGLARRLGTGSPARRSVMRALGMSVLVGALGAAAGQLGLSEAAAKKRHGMRRPERSGQVQDEKRRRKKRRRKKSHETQRCGNGELPCDDGSCVSTDQCCSTAKRCDDGSCIAANQCCPGATPPPCGECQEMVCEDGDLICRSTCQGEGAICCNGSCIGPCSGGKTVNPLTCECECPDGTVLMADGETCCPWDRACHPNETGYATVCCDEGIYCSEEHGCS